jgi:alkylated DNA repair protein alkB homolog 1
MSTSGPTVFKRKLQYHKRQPQNLNRLDDLKDIIDAGTKDSNTNVKNGNGRLFRITNSDDTDNYNSVIYGIRGYDGCLLMPQALSPRLQEQLAYQAVTEYCRSPHVTNVTRSNNLHEDVHELSMWTLWKQNLEQQQQQQQQPLLGEAKSSSRESSQRSPTTKLSWATMGYHYDWTERSYHKHNKSNMPSLVERIATKYAVMALRIQQQQRSSSNTSDRNLRFTPSAAIVNYYTTKSTMGGHKDDLEYTFDKPVVSISLGLPAVFILGGVSDHQDSVAILLRSGDVLTMGGASRLCIHGIARILPHPVAKQLVLPTSITKESQQQTVKQLQKEDESIHDNESSIPEQELTYLYTYLQHHRININVRQVYPDGDGNE